jgi:LPS export ABC transporter protein LptC
MNKRNSIILGLLFVIIVIEILVLAPKELGLSISEEEQESAPQVPKPQEGASGQIMQDVHLVEAKTSGKEWELWADKAMRPADNAEWTIEKVRVTFFANNGVTYQVTGKQGRVVPGKNDIRIAGNVVTRSSNGYNFKTESVLYDSKNRKLTSPGVVEMTGGAGKPNAAAEGANKKEALYLTGENMIADLDTNEIAITKNVRARRRVKDDREAVIQSDRAVFSGRSNSAQFFGNVVIDVDTMRLTGPEAKFLFNPKTEAFESVEVGGGVKVTDTDRFATSSSVSVHFKEDRVVFSGAPRVVQNGDELVGDEIVFLEGGKKVQVSNAKAQIDPRAVEKRK